MYNKFNSQSSLSVPYWTGRFKCIKQSCGNTALARIWEKIIYGQDVLVTLIFSGECKHLPYFINKRCTGQERAEIANKLRAHGTDNLRAMHILENYLNKNSNILFI
jgi:hypothetical protein